MEQKSHPKRQIFYSAVGIICACFFFVYLITGGLTNMSMFKINFSNKSITSSKKAVSSMVSMNPSSSIDNASAVSQSVSSTIVNSSSVNATSSVSSQPAASAATTVSSSPKQTNSTPIKQTAPASTTQISPPQQKSQSKTTITTNGGHTGQVSRATITPQSTTNGAIYVYSKERGTNVGLSGCSYTLTNSAGTTISQKQTDSNGMCVFTGLDYGSYTVTETSSKSGYSIITAYQVVSISRENKTPSMISYSFRN